MGSGVVRVGRAAVREFYADKFLPNIPPDLEITTVSQTFGDGRLVKEMAVRFTHTIDMDWLLPGVRPTGRKAELMTAVFIQFDGGKIAHEHAYWDQATVLSQLGVLDHPLAVGGMRSAAIRDDILTFVNNLNRSS
jgi:carboxymethylenebutenolidase